jgi:glucose dehydrogenase
VNTRPPAVTITPPLWGEPVRSPATLPSGTSQSFWSEYTFNGKQFLVIAAGGHGKLSTKQGDYVLAFALP